MFVPGENDVIDSHETYRPGDNIVVGADERAVKKPKDVRAFDAVGLKRPTMLAVTRMHEDPSASELFIQRAFKIDREFWRELEVSEQEMRRLDCLFEQANKLAWVPGSAPTSAPRSCAPG